MSRAQERLLAPKDQAISAPARSTSENKASREGAEPMTVTATEAQNEFGRVLDQATRDQVVLITRHGVPRAVLVSVERYRELASAESTILNTLTDEFDAMLARMQMPDVRSGTERGFRASPEGMGQAAEVAARRVRQR